MKGEIMVGATIIRTSILGFFNEILFIASIIGVLIFFCFIPVLAISTDDINAAKDSIALSQYLFYIAIVTALFSTKLNMRFEKEYTATWKIKDLEGKHIKSIHAVERMKNDSQNK